jgi:hypothetical protein
MVKDFSSEAPQAIKVTLRQPNTAKSRPLAPLPPKQTLQSAQEDVLGTVENVTEPRTKRLYSDIFMDAPSKKEYPEYYAIIKRVICLNEIQVCRLLTG